MFKPFLKITFFSVISIYSITYLYEQKRIKQLQKEKNERLIQKKKIEKIEEINQIKKVFNFTGSDNEVLKQYNNIQIFIAEAVKNHNLQLVEYYVNHPEIRGIMRITRWDPYEPSINITEDYDKLNSVEYTKKIYDGIRINENDINND